MTKPVFHVEPNEYGGWYVYRNGRNIALITPRMLKIKSDVFVPWGFRMASNDPAFRDTAPPGADFGGWVVACEETREERA